MDRANDVYRRADRVILRRAAGEVFLVPVGGRLAEMQRIFALNPVAAHLWEEIDGRRRLGEIIETVPDIFETDATTAARDADEFVGELLEAGLLEPV